MDLAVKQYEYMIDIHKHINAYMFLCVFVFVSLYGCVSVKQHFAKNIFRRLTFYLFCLKH